MSKHTHRAKRAKAAATPEAKARAEAAALRKIVAENTATANQTVGTHSTNKKERTRQVADIANAKIVVAETTTKLEAYEASRATQPVVNSKQAQAKAEKKERRQARQTEARELKEKREVREATIAERNAKRAKKALAKQIAEEAVQEVNLRTKKAAALEIAKEVQAHVRGKEVERDWVTPTPRKDSALVRGLKTAAKVAGALLVLAAIGTALYFGGAPLALVIGALIAVAVTVAAAPVVITYAASKLLTVLSAIALLKQGRAKKQIENTPVARPSTRKVIEATTASASASSSTPSAPVVRVPTPNDKSTKVVLPKTGLTFAQAVKGTSTEEATQTVVTAPSVSTAA